jgi:hypothetical protein
LCSDENTKNMSEPYYKMIKWQHSLEWSLWHLRGIFTKSLFSVLFITFFGSLFSFEVEGTQLFSQVLETSLTEYETSCSGPGKWRMLVAFLRLWFVLASAFKISFLYLMIYFVVSVDKIGNKSCSMFLSSVYSFLQESLTLISWSFH